MTESPSEIVEPTRWLPDLVVADLEHKTVSFSLVQAQDATGQALIRGSLSKPLEIAEDIEGRNNGLVVEQEFELMGMDVEDLQGRALGVEVLINVSIDQGDKRGVLINIVNNEPQKGAESSKGRSKSSRRKWKRLPGKENATSKFNGKQRLEAGTGSMKRP